MTTEEYEDLSVVDLADAAFIVIVEADGDATVKGRATGDYVVKTLRALADSIEEEGFNE